MSDIKLLALDLDGTLFTKDKQITVENRQALKAAREKGVKVVITTGRPLAAIAGLLEDLDLIGHEEYVITFNGGLVQTTTGRILAKSQLTRAHLKEIYVAFEPLGLPLDVLSDGIVYSVFSQGNKSLYHTANPLLDFVELDDFEQIPEDAVYNKVVTVTDEKFLDQQIAKLPTSLAEHFETFKSREIIFEVMPKGVHKATGLQLLIDHLGLDVSQVMTMGDEENDMTMLSWAGLGVAMANAPSHVQQVAKAVTSKTNQNSGVAEAIKKYILSEEN